MEFLRASSPPPRNVSTGYIPIGRFFTFLADGVTGIGLKFNYMHEDHIVDNTGDDIGDILHISKDWLV